MARAAALLFGRSVLGRGTAIRLRDVRVALGAARHFAAACVDGEAAAAMGPPAHVDWARPATGPAQRGGVG